MKLVQRLMVFAVAVLMCSAAMGQGAPAGGGAAPAGGGASTVYSELWNSFVSVFGTSYTVSTFTPDVAITVTRFQLQVPTAPTNCKTDAVLSISQAGATSTTLTITATANDSGTMSAAYAAGVPITLSVSTPAQCGLLNLGNPILGNAVVQYSSTT
jgi:hypothetical protein